MRLVISDRAVELIEDRGGRLYVRPKKARCCGASTTLVTSTSPEARREYRRVATHEAIEVFVPMRLATLPDELHVEVRRFPQRVEAYWNGCAWVV